ncbi:methyltransferase domain-containing protein [Actinomycetospora aeridis]|uniref:Methyltransferase domain-containing protein n=1 Tax=Actinomycetospora aeridis TaxID=3129231 RepID=A0ABU8NBE7_9PSEU
MSSSDTSQDVTPMEAEFDTVAAWTEQAVAELGRGYAIPAACRGSGSPPELAWLAEGLGLEDDAPFLDAGAGLGGPAAWLRGYLHDRWDGTPLLAEPMTHAAAASRRLFDLPAVAAWSQHLPLPDGSMAAAWLLGVLCTTSDKREVLAEVHRVLRPGGRLGLLVLVADRELIESPEGNDFPTRSSLHADLAATGFRVDDQVDGADLPGAPEDWVARADAVDEIVRRDHSDHPEWRQAHAQEDVLGRVMERGDVVTVLLHATAVADGG